MHIRRLHSWKVTPKEAVVLQRQFAGRLDTSRRLGRWKLIAGADISYNRFSRHVYVAVVVLRMPELEVVERVGLRGEAEFPYVPGLLSFREAPLVLKAFSRLRSEPDVVMFDGQGLAHPRRLGLASHLGLWLQLPCIGCAKSLLVGTYEEPGTEAGSASTLLDRGELIGRVVRTKTGVRPVFVSVGNRINLASCVKVVLATTRGYRIPEPTRQAHLAVNQLRLQARAALLEQK